MILYNDRLIYTYKTKLGKVSIRRKRLPDHTTIETRTFQNILFRRKGEAIPVIKWLMNTYNWKLHQAVKYFKIQTGVDKLTQRRK